MPHIRVVTDSTCDIPDTLLRQLDITVVPFSIQWGANRYLDKVNISAAQLWRPDGGSEPRPEAFAPQVEEFSRTYRTLRDTCDGVISIHVSSKLSDTHANAAISREAFGPVGHGGPFPVAVVDSLSVSMGMGWVVLAVARAARTGLELPRLVSLATRLRGQTHVAFFTETVEGLPGTTMLAKQHGQTLHQMKPLFHIEEGELEVYERTRTRAKARDALYNFVEDFPKIGEMAVIHTGAQNDVEHLLTRVGAIYPRERVVVIPTGAAVASWLGPEAVGVAVFEGEE